MTKKKPEIIIKLIAINGCGRLSAKFFIFFIESKNNPKYLRIITFLLTLYLKKTNLIKKLVGFNFVASNILSSLYYLLL